jgi:hypothetical protein
MIDLVHACLIIVASICFNGDADVRTNYGGLSSGASIQIEDVEIDSTMGSDLISWVDESRMEKKCVDDRCFFYATTCEPGAHQTACKVWYGLSPCAAQNTISFKSSDWLSLQNVRTQLYFIPFDGARVPFDELNYQPPPQPRFMAPETRERRLHLDETCNIHPSR